MIVLLVGVGSVLAYERSFFVKLAKVDVTSVLIQTASIIAVRLAGTLQRRTTSLQLRSTPIYFSINETPITSVVSMLADLTTGRTYV